MLERLKYSGTMNKLSKEKQVQIINALVEGNSLRATARMCDVAFNTVLKLLPQIGKACAEYQDRAFRNLPCKRIQCDEIWSFVYAKAKNVPEEKQSSEAGDVWTWVALDADTKLVPCWLVGKRDAGYAFQFMSDLASRLTSRVQLTTDGHKPYLTAVEDVFGIDIDYAQLVKIYGTEQEPSEARYSPPKCLGARPTTITGNPDPKHISTSYIERQNLTIRMMNRRFTRLTNAFSKKIENHRYSQALHYMHYNFCRIHKSLRVTPAMEAGVSNHVWSIEEIADLLN